MLFLFATASLAAAAFASAAPWFPAMVGDTFESALAALKARGVAYREQPAGADGGRRVEYSDGAEKVSLEFSPRESGGKRSLVLTHIRSVAPGSDARRDRVRTFEKEGQHWAYETARGAALRSASERSRYPVSAYLQWWTRTAAGGRAPSVTFLFQAARPVGSKPAGEETVLDVFLEDPRQPRRF